MKVVIKDGKIYNLEQMVSCEVRENVHSAGNPIYNKEKDMMTYATEIKGWKLIYKFSNGEEVNIFKKGNVSKVVTKKLFNETPKAVLDNKSEVISIKYFIDGEETDRELMYNLAFEKEKRKMEREILCGQHISEI